MAERGKRSSLPFEPLPGIGIRGDMLGKHLDGNRPVKASIRRLVYLSHSARTEWDGDRVGAEPRARGQGHRDSSLADSTRTSHWPPAGSDGRTSLRCDLTPGRSSGPGTRKVSNSQFQLP